MSWTTEQQRAIEARDVDLLVAAAAGSGKTAVLVERILQRITDPNDASKTLPAWRTLEAGMALTIEPGLYFRPSAEVPEEYWNIGIRIEDDAIVTENGCELTTRDVPVQADEIERLMKK